MKIIFLVLGQNDLFRIYLMLFNEDVKSEVEIVIDNRSNNTLLWKIVFNSRHVYCFEKK